VEEIVCECCKVLRVTRKENVYDFSEIRMEDVDCFRYLNVDIFVDMVYE
jgi:hypothetical protein